MDDICNLISAKRKEHGLTQAELGTMPGISGKAVSKWERGLSKPCDEHLARLIDLLDLPIETSAMAEEKEKYPVKRGISFSGKALHATGDAQVRFRLTCQPCNCYLQTINGSRESNRLI